GGRHEGLLEYDPPAPDGPALPRRQQTGHGARPDSVTDVSSRHTRRPNMVPGEYFFDGPEIELHPGRTAVTLSVNNTGDRPIQVGSHYHFFEANKALVFDRVKAYGMRPDLPSGNSVRFEPGD